MDRDRKRGGREQRDTGRRGIITWTSSTSKPIAPKASRTSWKSAASSIDGTDVQEVIAR
tara:strand:- start:96 stop:272 length:177 start_codon:yes stop_codon:yes gene_type:complete